MKCDPPLGSSEDHAALDGHFAGLRTGIGEVGSGGQRYAAAMALYVQGQMPVDLLEIYRRCSKLDDEDPIDLARFEGIAVPPFVLNILNRGER